MKNSSDQHERSRRGRRSRSEILNTAKAVFSELGPEATTLRLVARRAGVNIATVMYYFPNKERLFSEVLRELEGSEIRIVETWRSSLDDAKLSRLDSLKEALTQLGILIVDRVIDDPGRFRIGVFSFLDTSESSRLAQDPGAVEEQAVPPGGVMEMTPPVSPEKEIVRQVLARAVELGTLRCGMEELDDYIEAYSYLSRGFAMAHIQEIALGSERRDEIARRFRRLIYRYVNHMLPGQPDVPG